ncbi:hypothetical protein PILCRDRAFT_462174 [Piloderma croceum F 1598]|uniref:Uncharacterized protein n=1 Tax=Piloderma croceum (strain F 1598) TaxID=765440 RepID=A0A0C3FCN2_PILCF|nr:hypothetical protein PILCRDRAFT_462174 [Piloderma croceum F 1598]
MVQGLTVWNGESRIVLGIDVGATQSAVAFCWLYKGSVANVHRVSNWPGQDDQRGEPKIPTQIYYNRFGEAVKIGAETSTDDALDSAEMEGWFLARYFKLRLHPTNGRTHNLAMELEYLPTGITIMQIYVDFLRYLLRHTKEYFESHILQGQSEWSRYSPAMDVVIAHPNGWGVKEQDFLRRAAVTAGYVTPQNALSQIKFVSEADASVHFCIFHMDVDSKMNVSFYLTTLALILMVFAKCGAVFVVCDAGGATVNTTVYAVKAKTPLQLEKKSTSLYTGRRHLRRPRSGTLHSSILNSSPYARGRNQHSRDGGSATV